MHTTPTTYFEYEVYPSYVTITGYAKDGPKDVVIPNTIEGLAVKEIAEYAFYGLHLQSVVLPETLTILGEYAFMLNDLTAIEMPDSLYEIGEACFKMNRLEYVKLPNALLRIEKELFSDNQLRHIALPPTLLYIENRAFYNNLLEELQVSGSFIRMNYGAFAKNKLTHVDLPKGTTIKTATRMCDSFDRHVEVTFNQMRTLHVHAISLKDLMY